MPSHQKAIEEATERFTQAILGIIRDQVSKTLLGNLPKLPPKRNQFYLGPAKKVSAKTLPPQLRAAYSSIRKARHPVTSKTLSESLKVPEGRARRILGQLLNQSLLKKRPLGDGTARRVYLLSK